MAVLLILVAMGACSTKKNTWTRRTYHNLTSRYNVYWNGNESLKTGVKDFQKTAVDDYSEVIRLFNYGTKTEAAKLNGPMERALEKGAIGVQKHSMVFGGKERVKWIDDAYLMMGKAHFYKQDYISARRTFDFVARQFSYNEDMVPRAEMWLAVTYQQMQQYEKAAPLFEALENKARTGLMPGEVQRYLPLLIADYHLVRKNYDRAIVYLNQGLQTAPNKFLKTRILFILAQINQLKGNNDKALQYYAQVIKKNPSFDMDFEARINMARVYDVSQGESKNIIKILQKMLKDTKNEDYFDKVYYALAEIALTEKNEPLAMDYLAKSVSSSTKNKKQQSTSALKLAALYFEKNEYIPSQAYYDTAVGALPRDYPGYDSIKLRASILSELVENLTTIQLQDSLLVLANMDSSSRVKIINGIIKELEDKDREREMEDREMERNVLMSNQFSDRTANLNTSAEWYFYNPNTLSFGYTEFLRKWGRRKLEDNWRISDKQSITFENIESVALDGNAEGGAEGDTTKAFTDRDIGYYLKDIPLTDEAKIAAIREIEEAYNGLGYTYKERLGDFPRSLEAYSELNKRFPDSEYNLQSWYAQYRMNDDMGQTAEAERFKNLILQQFPNTDYARVIEDPDYFIRKAQLAGESSAFYELTLDAYHNQEYFRVLLNANRARSLYAEDVELIPRFDFLRAVAKGRIEVIDSMAVALEQLVKAYPTSAVAPTAAAILRSMNKEFNMTIEIPEIAGDTLDKEKEPASPYLFAPETMHLVMVVANDKVRIDPLKIRMSDFTMRDFKSAQLMIKSLVLDSKSTLVTIGNFATAAQADDFCIAVKASDYVFGGVSPEDYTTIPISLANYPIFYRLKNLSEYETFWNKNFKKE